MRSLSVDAECLHSCSLRPCGLVHKLGLELLTPGLELHILGHGVLLLGHGLHMDGLKFVKFEAFDVVFLVLELVCKFADLGICLVLNLPAIELAYDVSEEMCNLEFCCLVASLGLLESLRDTPSFELNYLVPVLHSEPQLCYCIN